MIPLVIHFFWCADKRDLGPLELFTLENARRNSGCEVVLHTNKLIDISGVIVRRQEFPTHIGGHLAKHIEHRVDIVRLQTAARDGGFYSDTDIVLFKSLIDLTSYNNIFAFQNKSYKTICIGFFGCSPDNTLIKKAEENYWSFYPPKLYWGLASFRVLIPEILTNSEIYVCPQKDFFPVRMKDSTFYTDENEPTRDFSKSRGIHLWAHVIPQECFPIVIKKLRRVNHD
jgi:mannosyltransferase OCH1-like enzyme